jgi:hypothetical protein
MGGGSFRVFIRIWSRLQFCSGACPSANSSSVMPNDHTSALQSYLSEQEQLQLCLLPWNTCFQADHSKC